MILIEFWLNHQKFDDFYLIFAKLTKYQLKSSVRLPKITGFIEVYANSHFTQLLKIIGVKN